MAAFILSICRSLVGTECQCDIRPPDFWLGCVAVQAPRNAALNAFALLGKKERGVDRALVLLPARRSVLLKA